ncbi:MAG: hypoxanthine phosphoribosyltransferase [Deltaproteobacteria bacterium]|nr:hypoxanthine phosphoribosyltransferase [Deltaproteobacteria bacterium]
MVSKRVILSEEQIQQRVRELAEQIDRDYENKTPILVGVLNGVFRFIADLTSYLTIPAQFDFVRISSYGKSSESSGRIRLTKDVELDLTGRHVLVIEDIVDSGLTLDWLVKNLKDRGAASIKTCVLIDKPERRECAVTLDYLGFLIEEGFLVGYGLDYAEEYRYLNAIYHLEL